MRPGQVNPFRESGQRDLITWRMFDFHLILFEKREKSKKRIAPGGGQISTMIRRKTAAQSHAQKSDFKKFQVGTMRIGKTGVFLADM